MGLNKNNPNTIHRSQWVSVYHHQVHSLFDELIHKTWGHQHWHAAADVIETGDAFTIEVDLPGVEPENIKVLLSDNRLIIEGLRRLARPEGGYQSHLNQRPFGKFYCSFDFGGLLDEAGLTRKFENGVLTVRILKKAKGQT